MQRPAVCAAGLAVNLSRRSAVGGRRVYIARQLRESLEGQVDVEHISENSFGHLAPASIYAPLKFCIDFLAALAALVVAAAIRLESRGPALFRLERMGYRGKPFTIYKFGSMREAQRPASGKAADMTLADDARVTRVGRFVR